MQTRITRMTNEDIKEGCHAEERGILYFSLLMKYKILHFAEASFRMTKSLVRFLLFTGIVVTLLFTGCKKEEPVSDVPSIEFVSVTPNPAVKYQDEIRITITATDGNGDLGENTPDVKNLFVTDSRNNVTYEFRINQLAPDNSDIIIRTNIPVILPPQGFIDDNNNSETVTYSVYVKDRAGNQSNTVQTSVLTINKP